MIAGTIAHVASFGVVDRRGPLDTTAATGLAEILRVNRLLGIGMAAVQGGDLLVSEQQAMEIGLAQTGMAALALELDSLTLRMIDDVGRTDVVVLKGMAHAHLEYPNASLRDYGDIDLYVGPRRFGAVEQWFLGRGFRRVFDRFAPRWAEEFGKSVTLTDGRIEVDLHRNLSQGLGLGVRPHQVLSCVETTNVGSIRLPVLNAEARLVHAALHAFGGSAEPPMNGISDLVRMAADPDRLASALSLARDWDLAGSLAGAIRCVAEATGVVPEESIDLVRNVAGSWNERQRMRLMARRPRRFRSDVTAGLLGLPGGMTRLRYVVALARSARD